MKRMELRCKNRNCMEIDNGAQPQRAGRGELAVTGYFGETCCEFERLSVKLNEKIGLLHCSDYFYEMVLNFL